MKYLVRNRYIIFFFFLVLSTQDVIVELGILNKFFNVAVKYGAQLEDGTLVSKSDGVEFTVGDGMFCCFFIVPC